MRFSGNEADAVIFDFDGTLADSMWVWNEVDRLFLEKRNIPFTKEFSEMTAVLGFESGADYVVEHFKLDESPGDIIEEWKSLAQDGYATRVYLKPGAREFIAKCVQMEVPIAIATSLQRHLLEAALLNNGILDEFDAVCICDELQCTGKSTPAVYLEAARQLGVDASRCVIFEDVVMPARSAKQTGAHVVGVFDEHKQQATDELREVADTFIMNWNEALDLIG